MNVNPQITFAIPFFSNNARTGYRYLKSTIDSVLHQTYQNWKLIVVDDRSPIDGVEEFVKKFGDSRIEYHRNAENKGQAGNWNICVSLIDTPFYTLLHADDTLEPLYAEKMLKAMELNPEASAIFCNAKIINEEDREIFSFVDLVKKLIPRGDTLQGDDGLSMILKGNFIMCPTVCYRRSSTKSFKFHEKDWSLIPDFYYWVILLLSDCQLVGISDRLFCYRRHSESGTAIGRKANLIFEQESRFYDWAAEQAAVKGWGKSLKQAQKKKMVKLRTIFFLLQDLGNFRLGAAQQKLGLISRM